MAVHVRDSVDLTSVDPMDLAPTFHADPLVRRNTDGSLALIAGRCQNCDWTSFPANSVCPMCLNEDIRTLALPSTGQLYAETTVHVAPRPWHRPMSLGYVDFEGGVRVFGHLQNAPEIGQTVEVALASVGTDEDGEPITSFVFRPAEVTS